LRTNTHYGKQDVLDNDKRKRKGEAKKRTGRKKVCLTLGKLTTDDGGKRSSSSIIFCSTAMLFVGNERECAHIHNDEEEKLSVVV
jgi:hypothetical protein